MVSFFPEPKPWSFGSADNWPAEGRPEAARGRLRGAGDRRNDGGFDGRRRLTEQSPTATAEPIDKGCTADARAPARHGAGGALLPRGVRGDLHRRVDREVKRTGGRARSTTVARRPRPPPGAAAREAARRRPTRLPSQCPPFHSRRPPQRARPARPPASPAQRTRNQRRAPG